MPTTPSQRSMRSNSNPSNTVTLADIKILIENTKDEIIVSLKKETVEISNKLSLLIRRVDELEKRNVQLEQRCNQLEAQSHHMPPFIFDEMEDRLRRRTNLIISGIPEQTSGTTEERSKADSQKVTTLLDDLCEVSDESISRVHRIGRQQPDKNRLLRVILSDEEDTKKILYRAKELRNLPPHKNIFINRDLTHYQREDNKKLREELKRRRASGEDVVIRSGKLVCRSQAQNFH